MCVCTSRNKNCSVLFIRITQLSEHKGKQGKVILLGVQMPEG